MMQIEGRYVSAPCDSVYGILHWKAALVWDGHRKQTVRW